MNLISKNIYDIPIIIIAGPTASGKSEFALNIAKELSGTIINFDSIQVYKDLKILSARPSEYHIKTIPHELYGFLNADFHCSAIYWRDEALIKIKKAIYKGRAPILVGGTGFYIHSLINGIGSVPKSLPEFRKKAESTIKEAGTKKFYEIVKKIDPSIINNISANDKQRLIRNYTVWLQTGKSLYDWKNKDDFKKRFFKNFIKIRLCPDRTSLRSTISKRFYSMIEEGALDEASLLKDTDLSYPIMKAHGVKELIAYINGKITFDEAALKTITNTRQYAKRQETWFSNKYDADYKISNYKNNIRMHIKKILNLYNKLY